MGKQRLVFVSGPAGCGKTKNGSKLADHFGCTVVVDGGTPEVIRGEMAGSNSVLVLTTYSLELINALFNNAEAYDYFEACKAAGIETTAYWRLDVEASRARQQKEFEAIPNGPTLAVLGEIQGERARQVAKGCDASDDDRYTDNELALAAYAYIDYSCLPIDSKKVPWSWPWCADSFSPDDLRTNLIKAAALLVAEVERLDRIKPGEHDHRCKKAPAGYQCTRLAGHDGPCAAVDTNMAAEP